MTIDALNGTGLVLGIVAVAATALLVIFRYRTRKAHSRLLFVDVLLLIADAGDAVRHRLRRMAERAYAPHRRRPARRADDRRRGRAHDVAMAQEGRRLVINISVMGTPDQQKLVMDALAKCPDLIDGLLKRPVHITFGIPANIPGTNTPAWGFTSGRRITLNANMAVRRPNRLQYTVIHELGHCLDADLNDASKRTLLMALMSPPTTTWNHGPYKARGAEAFADAFAEAEGFASPLDAYYADVQDLAQLLAILKTPIMVPSEPGDPIPSADPKDAVIAELTDAHRRSAEGLGGHTMTFADLLTAAGAGIAATVVTLAVEVIKTGLAKTPIGAWDGVMMAFILSAVLYVLAGVATGVATLDAGLTIFIAWLTCASAAVGVHKVIVNPIIAQVKGNS